MSAPVPRRTTRPLTALARLAAALGLLAAACSAATTPAPAPAPAPAAPTEPTAEQQARAAALLTGPDWYRHAVFYEVMVRSFQDSNGDGIGDLKGLTSRLDDLQRLGVDALWLMPIFKSPFKDSGYDVADYDAIAPEYGTDADLKELLDEAHNRKMRVFLDLVFNHTSEAHPWFQESRKDKTGPRANTYVWSDTASSPTNACGPFNAQFGTTPWTLDSTRNQYYFHRFYPGQPDLNFDDPAVVSDTLGVARRWLEKGVDGFRCDVIGLLYESPVAKDCGALQPKTGEYLRKLRGVLDTFPDRAMVAESVLFESPKAYFGSGSDMFQMAFLFDYGYLWPLAFQSESRAQIDRAFESAATFPAGAQSALVIGSHDVGRAYAVAQGKEWRHRRAVEIQLLARGTPYIYYGEELGLRPGAEKVVDNRDSARTPMPWTRGGQNHGFSTGKPWLALAPEADVTNVEAERAEPGSMYVHYKQLLALRRGRRVFGAGDMKLVDVGNPSVFAFVRSDASEAWLVAENLTEAAQSGVAEVEGTLTERALGAGIARREGAKITLELPATGSVVARLR
ncbi:MAG: trehalose synthase [Myxococcales bacterium]|nr:trehalose synthase [Myxococcales bacterium]